MYGLHTFEIKKMLEYSDLNKIIDLLELAKKGADSKIAEIEYPKNRNSTSQKVLSR